MCIVMHPGEKPKITEFTTASYNVPTKLQVGPKLIKLVGGGGGGGGDATLNLWDPKKLGNTSDA
jgi:hypothetical protein